MTLLSPDQWYESRGKPRPPVPQQAEGNLPGEIKTEHFNIETILGIDIGSVSISLVVMDLSGRILKTLYLFHQGQIRECLRSARQDLDLSTVNGIAVCAAPCFNPEFCRPMNTIRM